MMAQYLNINVRVPLPDDALMSAQIQTTALTCAQSFRDDIQQKMAQVGVQPDMTAAVVRVKGPKKPTGAITGVTVTNKGNGEPATVSVQTDIEDAIAATKPVEREIADGPVQQRAPTPPWAQQ
jgi:hypothetical protein